MTIDGLLLERLGIEIGHHTDTEALTGMTAFIMRAGATIGIHIPGGSAGTLNTPFFDLTRFGEVAHTVVLTGGSGYGLVSIFGVMRWLEENAIGCNFGGVIVPYATGAVIFDLTQGRGDVRPTEQDGYRAAASASSREAAVGRVGVGTGATTGKWYRGKRRHGGFAVATVELPHGVIVSAFVVTNAIGDVGEDVSRNLPVPTDDLRMLDGVINRTKTAPATTLAVIATNAAMERQQLKRVAEVASQGLARSIHPFSMLNDGDTIFALSSLSGECIAKTGMSSTTLTDIVAIGAAEAARQAALLAVS